MRNSIMAARLRPMASRNCTKREINTIPTIDSYDREREVDYFQLRKFPPKEFIFLIRSPLLRDKGETLSLC